MLVASLAAIHARGETLNRVLRSVLRQSRPPDKVVVFYSEEPWHLDAGWTQPPPVPAHPRIELRNVPNIGSMRKYLHMAQELHATDAKLVLIDDDRTWHPEVFARLADFVDRTGNVATTRGWSRYGLTPDKNGDDILRADTIDGACVTEPTDVTVANSGWATCFRARDVHPALFDPKLHEALDMGYSDEIVLSALLKSRKYVVPMPKKFSGEQMTEVHQWRSPRSTQAKLKQLAHYQQLRELVAASMGGSGPAPGQ